MKGMPGSFWNNFFKCLGFLLAFPVSCLAVYQGKGKPPNTVPVGIWIVSMRNNSGPQAKEGNGKIPKWLELKDQEEYKMLCFSTCLCANAQDKSICHEVLGMNGSEAASLTGKITHLPGILLNHWCWAFSEVWELASGFSSQTDYI